MFTNNYNNRNLLNKEDLITSQHSYHYNNPCSDILYSNSNNNNEVSCMSPAIYAHASLKHLQNVYNSSATSTAYRTLPYPEKV